MSMKRRAFLKIGIALSVLVITPFCFGSRREHLGNCRLTARRAVGKAYLSLYPEEQNPSQLSAYLAAITGRSDLGWNATADLDDEQFGLAQAIAKDFALGQTRLVHGWVLSLTECRVCAAAALVTSAV